jgi:tetratricopeptide (TPR) repeat protein
MGCRFQRLPSVLILLSCWVCALVCPEKAAGQFPGQTLPEAHGQILVRVHEADGSPIGRSAMVTVRSPSQLTNLNMPTTDAGQAVFSGLHAGDYTVEVTAPGYRTVQVQAIIAASAEVENVDVLMVPDSGAGNQQAPGAPILAPKALKETQKGMEALSADKLDEAEAHLKRALQMAPGYPDVNYLLGLLWMRRHDNTQARGYLEKTVSLSPKHAAALQALGEVEYLQHDYSHAIVALEGSIGLRPNSWRAHWLAGATYFQDGEFKKAEDQCEEALRVGQGKAGSVRFLLGAAQASLGEREAALANLEQFIREQPNGAQTGAAKKVIEQLRTAERPKAETRTPVGTNSGVIASREVIPAAGELTLPRSALAAETNWAPPEVDTEKPVVRSGSNCDVNQVATEAGKRVEELVANVDRFTATEEMVHQKLSPLGLSLSTETRTFNYLVTINKVGAWQLDVQEYRDGSVSTEHFPAHLATLGFPMLVLVFHPYYRNEYQFACEGLGEWRGTPAWILHFRQQDDQMSEMRVYRVNKMSFPIRLKGRAWIDPKSSQILAMEADMERPVPEIQLVRDYQMVEYAPVEFQNASEPMWLPKSADWYCNLMGQRYHRRHSFSQFLLFSIEDIQKIGAPKESDQK